MCSNKAEISMDPILPRELEFKIFELAAVDSLKSCAQLLLVARRVYYWFKPVLYNVLIFNNTTAPSLPVYVFDNEAEPKTSNMGRMNPALSHFAHLIKHVLIRQRFISDVSIILEHCVNIQDLALWIPYGDCSTIVPILEAQRSLKKMSFDPSLFFRSWDEEVPIPFHLPMFRNITHLEVVSATPSWVKWQCLTSISSLSHLALGGVVSRVLVRYLLDRCEALEVLVVYYFAGVDVWDDGPGQGEVEDRVEDDDRVLVLTTADFPGLVDMWEEGARGREGFWERVENFRRLRLKN